jgi:hypothetical protein
MRVVYIEDVSLKTGEPRAASSMYDRDSWSGQLGLRVRSSRHTALYTMVLALLREIDVEDGETHPAEAILSDMLERDSVQAALWIQARFHDVASRSPELAAALLTCIGRLTRIKSELWGQSLIRQALAQDSVAVREAAVNAVENWDEPRLVDELRRHLDHEPEAWLRRYMEQVIADLSGSRAPTSSHARNADSVARSGRGE